MEEVLITILRWLGFNLEFDAIDPEPVKVVPTQVIRVEPVKLIELKPAEAEVKALMNEHDEVDPEFEAQGIDIHDAIELGKPIACLMLTCKGCNKINPVEGCIAYEDPSLLLWHKLGQWCPLNSVPQKVVAKKKVKVNPLKASKREARANKAAKAA